MNNQLSIKPKQPDSAKKLMRDVLVFQGKLVMDGVRDLILSPVSIVVAIYGIVTNSDNPSAHFQSLMRFGRQTDDFINLFEHRKHTQNPSTSPKSDDYVEQLEAALAAQLAKENTFFTMKAKAEKAQTEAPDPNKESGK